MTDTALRSSSDVLDRKPSRRLLESEVAVSRIVSFLTTIPDPDEMLLRAGIKRHHLRSLELDDEVSQCIETRREAVVATPWRLEPNQTRIGRWLVDELEAHIDDLKRGVIDARFYGYSVIEVVFRKAERGRVGIERLALKPMEWFVPQRDGSLRYFPDDASGGIEGVACHPMKFLLTRCNASYRNPYGESLLSRLYFPVTWRREGWGMWLGFLETFGEPIILGAVHNYEDFVKAMKKQGVRSTVAWQSVSSDEHVQAITASTPGEFDRLEQALIRRVQKLILGQTLTSDVGSNGSYAVAAVHNEVRNDKRRADIRMVQQVGQRLVNILSFLNGWEAPRFVLADDSGLEMSRAQRDSVLTPVLSSSGYRLSEAYFLRNYDYTSEDLETVEAQTVTTDPKVTGKTKTVEDLGQKDPPVKDRSVVDGGSPG